MCSVIRFIIFLISLLCVAVTESDAARLCLWTDVSGRMHITEEPPAKGSTVQDFIEYESRKASQASGSGLSEAAETENRDKNVKCRNVLEPGELCERQNPHQV